ncbi:hypothetical protein Rhopal_001914-T1 [Rhodotorula paludigena]|uniref:Uncharacterized protein n=1 Tax=Rhodotorula paludigena TaxID=86838 RepID=A0AAV5GJU0_9BASI|nr:hypothetical protein Rhopal_001914-T1 [Rhodotorula paludigena]
MEFLRDHPCSVCATKTKLACPGCRSAGLEILFCGAQHQKLARLDSFIRCLAFARGSFGSHFAQVWPLHKQVCGARAKPFQPPPLSADESTEIATLVGLNIKVPRTGKPLGKDVENAFVGTSGPVQDGTLQLLQTPQHEHQLRPEHTLASILTTLRADAYSAKLKLNKKTEPASMPEWWIVATLELAACKLLPPLPTPDGARAQDDTRLDRFRHQALVFATLLRRRYLSRLPGAALSSSAAVPDAYILRALETTLDALNGVADFTGADSAESVGRLMDVVSDTLGSAVSVEFEVAGLMAPPLDAIRVRAQNAKWK